jgi:hypothetical protein
MSEQMKNVVWVITDQCITTSFGGKTYMIARTDAHADELISALKNKRYDEVPELVSVASKIERYGEGSFKVEDGCVLIDGIEVHGALAAKILQFADQKLPYEPLVKFARNVRKNPLPAAVDQLFEFLEKNNHPLTTEGNFIGYKTVRESMFDWHSNTTEYKLGEATEMPRSEVQHDTKVACGKGLHIANWHYASTFMHGGVMLKCECSPADVISIPTDCNGEKIRSCRITPIEIIERESDKLLEPSYENPEICTECSDAIVACECSRCGCCNALLFDGCECWTNCSCCKHSECEVV